MLKMINNKAFVQTIVASMLLVAPVGYVCAEMISPIDFGVIARHLMQQNKTQEFERSLIDLDQKNLEHQARSVQLKGVILKPEERKYLEDVKNCFENKQYKAVIAIANEALNLNPHLSELILYRGEAHFYLRNFSLALDDAQEFLSVNPNNEYGLILSSASNLFLRNYKESLKDCKRALRRGNDADAYAICGLNYAMYKDDNKKALEYAEKSLKLDPESIGALLVKGLVYLEENMPEQSIQEINKLVKMSPENPFALTIRAIANYEVKKYQDAEKDAIRSIDIYKDIPFNYYLLGQIYQKYDKKDESLKAYQTAKEMFYRYGNVEKAGDAEEKIEELYNK